MYKKEEQKALYELSKAYLDAKDGQAADKQLVDLRKLINYHEWRYSILNEPVLSDFEYDSLFKQLEAIEAEHPDWITPDSPTQRVSSDLTSDFDSVAHLTPMLSLGNSYNAEDLGEFDKQIKRLLNMDENAEIEYSVEPKFDGGSIALVYENDLLVRAATRGNGTIGDDITNNSKAIRSIPLSANFAQNSIHKIEVRGEVLIRKDRFDKMNEERAKADVSVFANARNAATGGLRMKDPKEVSKRNLEAFIYTLGYATDEGGADQLSQFSTHDDSLEFLSSIGFKVPVSERKVCKNIQEAAAFCTFWEEKRENYEYEIDGMVVKVNSRELQERCGHTSHHPRWAIAFKFQAKQATTKLEKVDYQVGKTGAITPVAKVAPVQLAGVTIGSISLHNADFISEKDLHIDDTVLIERAGDVIPYIVKAMPELRDGSEQKIVFPVDCPINDTDTPVTLVRAEGEAAWRCPNCVCAAQDLQRVIFHVSKPAMNIDGMGKSIVERFFEEGWIKDISDVYQLDYEKISTLEGFGAKSATNIEASIAKAKQSPIHRLLHSLTIHHLGKKVSKLLAQEINHVLDLQHWTEEEYVNIKDVGPKVAENVSQFFANEKNIEILKKMEALGVNMLQTEADKPRVIAEGAPLVGKTILFTGKLEKMSRKEAQMKAEAAGAKNISAVSSKLSILVAGEKAGSKLKKAKALETVQILTEDEFLFCILQTVYKNNEKTEMEFAGKGGRKPMLDINSSIINLDRSNPRLIPYLPKSDSATQLDLITILYEHFDSENIGLSLVQNGYFDEEPIVVIPTKLPPNFNFDSFSTVELLTNEYKRLIEKNEIEFTVVEGNRRLSAIKLISDDKIRNQLGLDAVFPVTKDVNILHDITNIPAIIYPKREDVYTYLGIRHIAGNLKWEAFAQASYTANMIQHYVSKGGTVNEAIKEVQNIIAHRSDKLIKQYVTYKLFQQANNDLNFNTKPIINKFSLLTVAYNSGAIRDYVGLPKYKDVNFEEDLVTGDKLEEFRNLLTWIYGDKKRGKSRVLTDSRKITSDLSYVVKSEDATEYLLKYEDLDGAFDRTTGEKEFLLKKIRNAHRAISSSLQYAYKYKEDEQLKNAVNELKEVISVLEENIAN